MIDKETKNNLDYSVVHVGTVPNSSHMEKQGLIDSLESIEKNGMVIKALTTDRHIQIRSYMKKRRWDIKHQFDVYNVFHKYFKKQFSFFELLLLSNISFCFFMEMLETALLLRNLEALALLQLHENVNS